MPATKTDLTMPGREILSNGELLPWLIKFSESTRQSLVGSKMQISAGAPGSSLPTSIPRILAG